MVWNKAWYWQIIQVIGWPIMLYITIIRTVRLAVKLTEIMDEHKNNDLAMLKRIRDLETGNYKPPIIPDDAYSGDKWNGDMEVPIKKYEVFDFKLPPQDGSGPVRAFDSEKAFKGERTWVTIQVEPGDYVLKLNEITAVENALKYYCVAKFGHMDPLEYETLKKVIYKMENL